MPPQLCYCEDLAVGQHDAGGTATVDAGAIKAFAAAFDPQPSHLDEAAAKTSVFGGLVASGWHTMALTMRMLVDGELHSPWGLVGLGADELRWPRPVYPGDVLRIEWEVIEVRPSSAKPDRGTARLRVTTRNQRAKSCSPWSPRSSCEAARLIHRCEIGETDGLPGITVEGHA